MTITRRGVLQPLAKLVPQMPGKDPGSSIGTWQGGLGGAPMAFTAQAALTVGQKGINLDLSTLQPGFRTGYFIDEVRISVFSSEIGDVPYNGVMAGIRAQFQTGIYKCSAKAIPVALYAPRFSQHDSGNTIINTIADEFQYNACGHVRWCLPKPLYMGPGDALQCTLERDTLLFATPTTVTVKVTYVGRAIAQGATPPATRCVPWVAYFEKYSNTSQVYSQTEFRNPFMFPYQVQRLTSRAWQILDNDEATFTQLQETNNCQVPNTSDDGDDCYERVMIEDSNGYKVTGREEVPAGALFDLARRAWTFSRTMGAKEQYNVRVTNLTPTTTPSQRVLTQFGMVGYREEQS